jgi:hypothetical protein
MPEEYDYEPDSSECQLTDRFIEALMFGKGPAAAASLRELNELDGDALECLVWLLGDNQPCDSLFPYRLQFRYRRQGKPKCLPSNDCLSTTEEKFIGALAHSDGAAASAALRDMKRLRGGALELIAELLEDGPRSSFPTRLLFKYRRQGRPYHRFTKGAKSLGRSHAFESAKADIIRSGKKPKAEAAVADVTEKTGHSRATVFRALRQHRRRVG